MSTRVKTDGHEYLQYSAWSETCSNVNNVVVITLPCHILFISYVPDSDLKYSA